MDLLPHLHEDHGDTAVLAQGHPLSGGDLGILKGLAQQLPAQRGLLHLPGTVQGGLDIIG